MLGEMQQVLLCVSAASGASCVISGVETKAMQSVGYCEPLTSRGSKNVNRKEELTIVLTCS